MTFTYDYPRPAVTVDALVICKKPKPQILLIQRANEPFKEYWAFPGGFLDNDETLEAAVARELQEETNLTINSLEQFKAYSAVERDSRGRTITVAFYTLLDTVPKNLKAQDDAKNLQWFPLDNLPLLAFDHQQILDEFCTNIFLK